MKLNELAAKLAIDGAKKGACGRMCTECAFKLNSAANNEPRNVAAAINAVESTAFGKVLHFNCHNLGTYENAGKLCNGYLNALKSIGIDKTQL